MAARGERLHPKARGAAVAAASRTAAQISLEAMQGLHTATAPAPMPYSDADVLLLDRLLALEPALKAHHREARVRKQNVHGPKGLIADESVLLANAARHTGFDLGDPISSHTNRELKQLQRDTLPAADADAASDAALTPPTTDACSVGTQSTSELPAGTVQNDAQDNRGLLSGSR